MNVKRMSLALAALALVSTGSAFAQSVDVNAGPVGASVNVTPVTTTVGNVVAAPVRATSTLLAAPMEIVGDVMGMPGNLVKGVFNPPGPWFELSVLGAGIKLGDNDKVVTVGSTPSAMLLQPSTAVGMTQFRTIESARVIPGSITLGAARPLSASIEGPKPMAHIDLFGLRLFRFGSVSPSIDMRDK